MPARQHNYLSLHRRRWGLTQGELASLLGVKSRTTVSRFESGQRKLCNNEMLACEVIFGVPARELFPSQYHSIEDAVMRRAAVFSAKLERRRSASAIVKRKLLEAMIDRADNAGHA